MPTKNQLKVWFGIAAAIAFLGLASFGLYTCSLPFAAKAHAGGWPLPDSPYVYLGLEYEFSDVFCGQGPAPKTDWFARNHHLVANLGLGQALYQSPHLEVVSELRHHSCAFNTDLEQYNALGVTVKWHPWQD